VMHDREPHVRGVARRPTPDRLVRSPREAGNDRGCNGRGGNPERNTKLRAPDEMRPNASHAFGGSGLDAVRGADPPRIACGPTGEPPLPRAHIGPVLGLRRSRPPGTPATARGVRSEQHLPASPPGDAGEREARDRDGRSERVRTIGPKLDRRRVCDARAEGRWRNGKRSEDGGGEEAEATQGDSRVARRSFCGKSFEPPLI